MKIEDIRYNLGREADILDNCIAALNKDLGLNGRAAVREQLEQMAKRMREREKGIRA